MNFSIHFCYWLCLFFVISFQVGRVSGALQCTTQRLDDLKHEIIKGQRISNDLMDLLKKPGESVQTEFKLELKSFQAEIKWMRNEFLWLHKELGEMHQVLTDVKNIVKRKIRNDTKFIREQVVDLNNAMIKADTIGGVQSVANSTSN